MIPILTRDPSYPLLPWLIQLYTSELDPYQTCFNQCLGQNHVLVECTLGHLKGCWCTPTAHLKFTEVNIPHIIVAVYVLHNICKA